MANHVSTYVSFENLSKEAEEFLTNIDMSKKSDEVLMNFVSEEVGDTRQDWVDAFGAKWVYFDDISENTACLVSAWSPPEALLDKMYDKLHSLNSPNLELWATYDDEMPNFIGTWGRIGDFYYEEYVEDEHYESIIGCNPHILDEEGDWEDYNEDWPELLDKWHDSEYECFKQCYAEHLEELEILKTD